uniref:asparagine synthase (glutamine-hydrolyzing) n=1 Tax=Nitrospira cf. moscoviensis SBR1015 TaxID=96242 RepID=UPI000B3BBEF2|nr:asparagine synthase (glutamine-hydrolyzing) [Nitrospira cf. moscoviensis SBR1015]
MCGISGIVYEDPAAIIDRAQLIAMRDCMTYRGPDDAGLFIDGPVGLGHRRLSIIDLGGGHQPMSNEDGSLRIVFNGEIYNYRSLREELKAKGHQFQSQSDTEVILHLYADRGEACVHALNGMFAFAIWDAHRRVLFLARDRMGVKPLYYAVTPKAFLFASEIKAILTSGMVSARCRDEAVAEYMLFRQVAGPESLFEGVMNLPPGCTLTLYNGKPRIARYWSSRPAADRPRISYDDARQTLTDLLHDSVNMRLISDVPVGTFCSGGVDSSLVTALASRIKGDRVNTFSIGFDEPEYDESAFALMVSKQYGTIHHQLTIGNAEFSDLFPQMVWQNDEPLNFANSVQIFALSRLAKQHVTVVLTGEGSDELFAGYPRYRIPGMARIYRQVPGVLRRLAKLWGSVTRDHRVAKLDRYAACSPMETLLYNSSMLHPDVVAAVYPQVLESHLDYRRSCLVGSENLGLDDLDRVSLLDQECFLVSILNRQDKMSMAASIESRVPFMDYRIVEFANRLPAAYKLRGGTGKAIVKDVARAFLPVETVDRRKSGFGVPLDRWFRSNLGMGERIAALPEQAASDLFDGKALRRLVEEHRAGTHDHSELLWTVLNFQTWKQTFHC